MQTIETEQRLTLVVTRRDLIADGEFVDIAVQAGEVGMKSFPGSVVITRGVDALARASVGKGELGGALTTIYYDIAWMMMDQLHDAPMPPEERRPFVVIIGDNEVTLDALVTEDEQRRSVVTVLLQDED